MYLFELLSLILGLILVLIDSYSFLLIPGEMRTHINKWLIKFFVNYYVC